MNAPFTSDECRYCGAAHSSHEHFARTAVAQAALSSKTVSSEQQRNLAFGVFLASLDAKDMPVSMAAAFQAGWDACMRRERPVHETSEGYSQAYADQMRNALLTIATSSLTPDRVRQFAHNGLLRSFPVEPSPENGFCRHCGARIPPLAGEGTCPKCDPEGCRRNAEKDTAAPTKLDFKAFAADADELMRKHGFTPMGGS